MTLIRTEINYVIRDFLAVDVFPVEKIKLLCQLNSLTTVIDRHLRHKQLPIGPTGTVASTVTFLAFCMSNLDLVS